MYKYSTAEKGKDGTINPNYYVDKAPFSNKMAMAHLEAMFPVENVRGFFKIAICKYIIRAGYKGPILQDIKKVGTYSKLWGKYEEKLKDTKRGVNNEKQ